MLIKICKFQMNSSLYLIWLIVQHRSQRPQHSQRPRGHFLCIADKSTFWFARYFAEFFLDRLADTSFVDTSFADTSFADVS